MAGIPSPHLTDMKEPTALRPENDLRLSRYFGTPFF